MNKDVIIACDFKNKEDTFDFLDIFKNEKPFVKIGMELFYGEGPQIVKEIKSRGHKIFLDLKLHDIPNTVQHAMRNLARLGVNMTNVHAGGGKAMMEAAKQGLIEGAQNNECPNLIAVTMLTSISQKTMNKELCIAGDVEEIVAAYAKNTMASGLNGVVCSPIEAGIVKKHCGENFLTITPGIRYPNEGIADQSRVTTPKQAAISSDYIVIGRPITANENPSKAYEKMRSEFLA